jgi:hypothetical protein
LIPFKIQPAGPGLSYGDVWLLHIILRSTQRPDAKALFVEVSVSMDMLQV